MCDPRVLMGGVPALIATLTLGEVIYETDDPFGGLFGLWGVDVCIDQSAGLRFTPGADFTLDCVSVWFMNNSATVHALVEVTLRTDDDSVPGVSIPSNEIVESWTFNVSAVGWNPVLEVMGSVEHPLLESGSHYWIVCESFATCGIDGVWNFAGIGSGFMAYGSGPGLGWQPGGTGGVAATIIEGTAAASCPWDLDGGGVGITDFLALLAAWGLNPGHPADFDGDGVVGILDFLALLANWGPCS